MTAHRYWRYQVDAVNFGAYTSCMELQLRTSIGGSSVATGGTASASSTGFGWVPANAFDGSTGGNGWHSGNAGFPGTTEWLQYDFGAGNDKDIVEFAVFNRPANVGQVPSEFRLQYSDDGVTFTTKFTVKNDFLWDLVNGGYRAWSADSRPDDGVNKRFWRLRSTAVDGGTCLSLSALSFFDGSSSLDQATGGLGYSSTCITGEDNTLWASDSLWEGNLTAEWIGYKFASAKNILAIGIKPRSSFETRAPKNFVVEYWDGSTYQTAFSFTGATSWATGVTRYFSASGEITGPPINRSRPIVFVST